MRRSWHNGLDRFVDLYVIRERHVGEKELPDHAG